jgi:broad specificity phosphatase PhoE/8-oxo-dGTP pyrophosphatase MutT (NUDIX family)
MSRLGDAARVLWSGAAERDRDAVRKAVDQDGTVERADLAPQDGTRGLNRAQGPYANFGAGSAPGDIEGAMADQGMGFAGAFAPGRPLAPYFPDGTPARQYDFPAGVNIASRPRSTQGKISFATLQNILGVWDTARICIEHIEDDIRSLGPLRFKAKPGYYDDVTDEITRAETYWRKPDGFTRFDGWQQMFLEDLLRFDAPALSKRRTRNGRFGALEVTSGVTIAPLIDFWGHPPEPPAPNYVQYIQGVPLVWLDRDDFIYSPFRMQPESPYGYPPIEWLLLTGNTDIRWMWHFLTYFTEGTMPEAFMEAPPDMSDPEQIVKFQAAYDAVMEGDAAQKHRIKWVPAGSKPSLMNNKNFDAAFPLHLIRKTAAAYKVTPNDLGFTDMVNKASSDTQTDVQFRIGTLPRLTYLEGIYTEVTQQDLGLPLVAYFDTGREQEDRKMEAEVNDLYVKMGAKSPEEVRDEVLGLKSATSKPRFLWSPRLGAVPLRVIYETAGEVDPETGAPDPDQVEKLDAEEARNVIGLGHPKVPQGPPTGSTPSGVAPPQLQPQPPIGAVRKSQADSHQPGLTVVDLDPAGLKRAITGLAKQPSVLLLRHGETQANKQGLLRSWTDPPLNAAGKKSAADLADALTGAPVHSLSTSDLQRAADTAAVVSKAVGVEVKNDKALRPWNLGKWAGTPAADHLNDMLRMERTDRDEAPPDGESFNTFLKRYIPRLQKAFAEAEKNPDGFVVLVTHVRNLRVAEAWLEAGGDGIEVDSKTLTKDDEIGPGGYEVLALADGKGWGIAGDYQEERGRGPAPGSQEDVAKSTPGVRAAGLAVKAGDTGRVLMLQRSNANPSDRAGGTWEFPGGKLEEGEDAYGAACREWQEETGAQLPPGDHAGSWTSPDGVYRGFVHLIDQEAAVLVNTDPDRRAVLNPDDPDQDDIEVAAWWDPVHLPGNPALRPEVLRMTDWDVISDAGGLEKALRERVARDLFPDLARLEASQARLEGLLAGRAR